MEDGDRICTDPEGWELFRVLTKFYDWGYVGTDIGSGEREGLREMAFPSGSGRTAIELVWKGQRIGDIVVMLRDELWPDE